MADNNQQKQSKPEKKKKQSTTVKLPNARKSIRRQRQMAQGKANYEGWMGLLGTILLVGIIAFILMGGVNQRKLFETCGKWSQEIGQKFTSWFNPDDIVVNDDGIYYKPGNCAGKSGNTSTESEQKELPEASQENTEEPNK